MPEMDGYMLMRQVRLRTSEGQISAIALTAYAGDVTGLKQISRPNKA